MPQYCILGYLTTEFLFGFFCALVVLPLGYGITKPPTIKHAVNTRKHKQTIFAFH